MADLVLAGLDTVVNASLAIVKAADTAKQNKEDCLEIARVAADVQDQMNRLKNRSSALSDPSMSRTLEGIEHSLKGALRLVNKCQDEQNCFCFIFRLTGADDMSKKLERAREDISSKVSAGVLATVVDIRIAVENNNQHGADQEEISESSHSRTDQARSSQELMLRSRVLHIEHVDAPSGRHWRWTKRADSRFRECAELLEVHFLAVSGQVPTADLDPGINYEVYLVYRLTRDAVGLKGPQTSEVRLPSEGNKIVATSRVCLDPAASAAAGVVSPVHRDNGWMELKLADLVVVAPDDNQRAAPADTVAIIQGRKVIVDFIDRNDQVMKTGLIMEGMEFRPKR